MRKPPKPNKTVIILLSLLAAFAILLALYLAVLSPLFATGTGDTTTTPPLVTLPGEGVGLTGTVGLMFPRLERSGIKSIRVYQNYTDENGYTTYAFLRDVEDKDGDNDTYDYIIEEFPAHVYVEENFSELVTAVGYATYAKRLDSLNLADKSETELEAVYADFGLSPADNPTYYELTDNDGKIYTVYIGAKAPDGNYYARLGGRAAVYVVPASTGNTLKQPITYFAEARLTFDADSQYGYVYIENFGLFRDDTFQNIFFGGDGKVDDVSKLSPYVMFTYLDKPERDLFHSSAVYGMLAPNPVYAPYDLRVDLALQKLPGLTGTEVLKLGLSASDFAEGGLLSDVAYTVYYEMPYGIELNQDSDPDSVEYWVKNVLFITRADADGNYTVGSLSYREGKEIEVFYNLIAKVEKSNLSFVEYSVVDWVEPSMFNVSLDDIASLEFSSEKGDYLFEITGDGTENQTAFEKYLGYLYTYQGDDKPFAVNGQGYCEDIDQFRSLYHLMVKLHYEGEIAADSGLSREEIANVMADDSNCLLTVVLTMDDGRDITYRFYAYSERHAMVSLSGDGIGEVTEFFTLRSSVIRIAEATWQLTHGAYIDINYRY